MRVPQLGRSRTVELNVTPMIDVVFLLIIFFLVSSHLARQETQVAIDLPTAQSGLDDPRESSPRVTLNALGDGTLLLGGVATPVEEIERRLAYQQRKQDGPLEVRLRADRQLPFGSIEPLLRACADADVWSVEFAVTSGER